jgi:hypothetical protein
MSQTQDPCKALCLDAGNDAVLGTRAGRADSRVCSVVYRRVARPHVVFALAGSEPQEAERNDADVAQCEAGTMLNIIAVILVILWLLGLMSGYSSGVFIHGLLVIAIVYVVTGLVTGRRPAL